ncbi:flagellar regulator YcgR PilZN domain-containing protein [Methylomarinum sp. Ch1-1]|uniref:Flagellar regulator YcgR PilZN domain-containing protein n=1 Tax=Methylomarinum roseum TaxID=3067653 RepID=A0AAU7NUP8_9GAMM|nr:flagellar regulator YcgR PilZN domain-containing protein [Methylomarinum sp. Ch1-1]MDP4519265.1 flagellar brake protein [Methylomarinum sp. Ch1-1]
MLRTLKSLFRKKQNANRFSSEEQYQPKSSSNPNFLTEPCKITRLLKDIESTAPLCTITLDGSSEEFSSSILDIKTGENKIILDELLPEYGNNLLHHKRSLKLSTYCNGIHLAFKLEKIQFGSSNGLTYYKARFPERIYYPQRRKAPRLEIITIKIPFTGIASKNNTSLGGHVFDLSRTGIGINLPDNRSRIQRGDRIKKCSIVVEGYRVDFDLTVRFVKKGGSSRTQTTFGGYFENLSTKSQNKLSYFITALEREEIRKQKA